jgi:hypothetical protein
MLPLNNRADNSKTKAPVIRIDRASTARTRRIPSQQFSYGSFPPPVMHETAELLADISVKTLMNIHGLDRGAAQQALDKALKSSLHKNSHR